MSRRLNRFGLLLACLLASEVWALGLGDIRLNSALNEPLRAEIELLSATPEELSNLRISLAAVETFERYGIDRPLFLSSLNFQVARVGGRDVIRVTSGEPITEPFLTFLVEAVWPRGRLLREYTVLLDPPTFAPMPDAPRDEAVAAPTQSSQNDRGTIRRQPPRAPVPSAPAADSTPFDTTAGGDYEVRRGDTLWRIAERVRPDNRLTMSQVMLAIYEANPGAFAGNINVLRANVQLRIPSADDIFRISRGDAASEIQRQNRDWGGGGSQPTLTLVPPDGDQAPYDGSQAGAQQGTAAPGESTERIRQLEDTIAEQESLLEVRDNELAQLRSELARLREEREQAAATGAAADTTAAPADDAATDTTPADDDTAADDIFVDDSDTAAADTAAETDEAGTAADDAAQPTTAPAPRVSTTSRDEKPGLVDTIIDTLTSTWGLIGAALLVVLGVLAWFARRASGGRDDAESTRVWDALDEDDVAGTTHSSTEQLRALGREDEDTIVVVEGGDDDADETQETPALEEQPSLPDDDDDFDYASEPDAPAVGDAPVSHDDTFSSETAINLDQSDPIAEADFHMAYGLYDQAADLINGALAVEPERRDLLSKLCEIYFVWGNRDAFVDAATNLKNSLGDGEDERAEWDKIVIMGQQIAADAPLFSGARAGAAQAVDLDFESSGDVDAGLDIDFDSDGDDDDVIDLGAEEKTQTEDDLDFDFGDSVDASDDDSDPSITQQMPDRAGDDESTVESPTIESEELDDTGATVEQPAGGLESTSELPSLGGDDLESQLSGLGDSGDATAEIDLDDLGLDLDGLAGDLDDDDDLLTDDEPTGTSLSDDLAETGRNPQIPSGDEDDDVDVTVENALLDATGQTQILPDDFAIETASNLQAELDENDEAMLSSDSSDDPEFDFTKTESLPKDSLDTDEGADEATSLAGSTDMDLDLDDLTAALKRSDADDTAEQPQPGDDDDLDLDFDLGADDPTQQLGPDEVSDDLQDARTMTEVGTKLDLARAYVDMGDPGGARNILEEVLEEGDESQRQQAQQLLDTLPD